MTSGISDSASANSSSNHSKEYFTIGNRFEQSNLTSLLNGTIPDDTEDELNTFHLSGTLGRNSSSKASNNQNLPNKSFNTYATHNPLNNNNSKAGSGNNSSNIKQNCAGLNLPNSRLSVNAANINATNRLSNYGIVSSNSSTNPATTNVVRTTLKQQPRNSFAFTMRTNLDQEL